MNPSDGFKLDPSSISLFASSSVADKVLNDEKQLGPSTSQTLLTEQKVEQPNEANKEGLSYSKYAQKKSVDSANRRNLIERLEKLKSGQGLNFTIPQFKQNTMYQLSLLLRRLRRSSDAKTMISNEMIEKIFANESTKPKQQIINAESVTTLEKPVDAYQELARNELMALKRDEKHPGRTKYQQYPQLTEDEEATDEESTDYEDDDFFGPKTNLSVELFDLLEQRVQILTADKQAKRIQEEIRRKRQEAEAILASIIQDDLAKLAKTQEKTDDTARNENIINDDPTMTSARCRPIYLKHLAGQFSHELVKHVFNRNEGSPVRPIISNKKCGTREYAYSDDSVHPMLSTHSSIPLDSQLQKYLHVASFVQPQSENTRYRTAQAIFEASGKDLRQKFYNLADETREDDNWRFASPETTKSIKISLAGLGKHGKKDQKLAIIADYDSEADNSDQNDLEFIPSISSKKRRRMTMDHHPIKKFSTSKSSKVEGRRMSQIEYGASMFDFDSQLMDIGLPLPAIQKVENVEITIPSFRKKSALHSSLPACTDCDKCQLLVDAWTEIRRLHGELEAQERHQRFRPSAGSTTRKMTLNSTEQIQRQNHSSSTGNEQPSTSEGPTSIPMDI